MKRITEKDGNFYKLKKEHEICGEENGIRLVQVIAQYENIEEELKCPLNFCITPYRLTGLKKIWYRKQWCEVVRIVIYEEATRPYMEVRVKELKNLKIVFLDDYGETWALTKEELENE